MARGAGRSAASAAAASSEAAATSRGGDADGDGIINDGARLASSGGASGSSPQGPRPTAAARRRLSASLSTSPLAAAARSLLRDNHTYWDGVLLISACQIGQIMLVLPRAAWLSGLVPASLVAVATLACGVWTIHVLLALYLEYKCRMLARGQWYEVEAGDEGRIGAEAKPGSEGAEVEVELVAATKASALSTSTPTPTSASTSTSASTTSPPPILSAAAAIEEDDRRPPASSPTARRRRLRVTQYHDVAGELGGPMCRALVVALTALTLFGVGVAQILACSSNFYYISGKAVASSLEEKAAAAATAVDALTLQQHSRSKRDWALIWGLPMSLLLFVPGYRSSRLLSVLAIAGTTFTAWYVVAASAEELNRHRAPDSPLPPLAPPNLWPRSPRGFFVGGSVIMSALGAHTICMEIFEMLRQPVRFTSAFVLGQVYVWTLVAPQSLAANVAFSSRLAGVDTVYGVLPYPDWRMRASVWLMNVHQVLVFGFILMPLFYYSERAFGVHARRFGPARAAARVPVVAAVMLVALAFPFYGGFNALFAAIGVPSLSFAIPCYLYNRTYLLARSGGGGGEGGGGGGGGGGAEAKKPSLWSRAAAARAAAPHPPPRLFGLLSTDSAWKLAFAVNAVLGTFFVVAGSGAGVYYSVADMVAQASKWGVFAKCYQCVLPPKAAAGVG